MTPPDDDDEFLSAELLALEEAKLQALGPSAPLPPAQVDALVARATKPAGCSMRRLLLLAGLLALAISPLGWIGARIVWPQEHDALRTLDYADAVEVATNPDYSVSGHESAVGLVAQACFYGITTLKALSSDREDSAVRSLAESIREDLQRTLTELPLTTPAVVEGDFVAVAATVADARAPVSERLAAMNDLSRMMRSGLMALRASREHVLQPGLSVEKATHLIDRLARELEPFSRPGS